MIIPFWSNEKYSDLVPKNKNKKKGVGRNQENKVIPVTKIRLQFKAIRALRR